MQIQTFETNYNYMPVPVMFNGDPIKDNRCRSRRRRPRRPAKKAPAKKAPAKKAPYKRLRPRRRNDTARRRPSGSPAHPHLPCLPKTFPTAPLPLGVMADSGERLASIDAGARDFSRSSPRKPRSPMTLSEPSDNPPKTIRAPTTMCATQRLGADRLGDYTARAPARHPQAAGAVDRAPAKAGGNDKLFQIFDGKDSYAEDESASDWLIKNGKNIPNQTLTRSAACRTT